MTGFTLDLPDDFLERVAERAAEILADRLTPAPVRWMTVEEAAKHARCKPQRIYDLRYAGVLSKTGDRGRVLVDREELDFVLERGTAGV